MSSLNLPCFPAEPFVLSQMHRINLDKVWKVSIMWNPVLESQYDAETPFLHWPLPLALGMTGSLCLSV